MMVKVKTDRIIDVAAAVFSKVMLFWLQGAPPGHHLENK